MTKSSKNDADKNNASGSSSRESSAGENEMVTLDAEEVETIIESEAIHDSDKDNTSSASKAEKSDDSPRSSGGKGFSLLLFIVLLILLIAAGYYFYDHQLKQNQLLEQQEQRLSSITGQLTQFDGQLSSSSSQATEQAQQLVALQQQIEVTQEISQQAAEKLNRSQRDWMIAEIDYMLRMAHQRLEVARDISGAIAALKGADKRIAELGDLRLMKIRKQLINDIGLLNAVQQIDVNGISMEMDQMLKYMTDLPFKSAQDEIKVQLKVDDSTAQDKMILNESTTEKSFVDSVIDTVKQIGDIKVHERSIKTASGAYQQQQIEQLLSTHLLSARMAALSLSQQQFVYEVDRVSQLLQAHYQVSDNRVEQMLKTLNQYSTMQLKPDLPELTDAWSMLQQEIEKANVEDEMKPADEKNKLEGVKS